MTQQKPVRTILLVLLAAIVALCPVAQHARVMLALVPSGESAPVELEIEGDRGGEEKAAPGSVQELLRLPSACPEPARRRATHRAGNTRSQHCDPNAVSPLLAYWQHGIPRRGPPA